MTSNAGKGDLAYEALKGKREPELADAMDDLAALHALGALAGVAEILRERRRQVDATSYRPEHDDRYDDGALAARASVLLGDLQQSRLDGTADIGSDEGYLRAAGSFCAIEIDRLNRMMTPGPGGGEAGRCRCGHPQDAHDHYRRGTECALCAECPRFRPWPAT